MKKKQTLRLVVDALLLVLLFVIMAYSLTGNTVHEWMGIALTLLTLVHLYLNKRWFASLFQGKYRWRRVATNLINSLLLISFLVMLLASMPISAEVFPFVHLYEEEMWPATLHVIAGYWFFILSGLHLGFQWPRIMKHLPKSWVSGSSLITAVQGLISLYGFGALWSRGLFSKMTQFSLEYFEREPDSWRDFIVDYTAIFIFMTSLGYYLLVKRK